MDAKLCRVYVAAAAATDDDDKIRIYGGECTNLKPYV
jgi:hypothetical protein